MGQSLNNIKRRINTINSTRKITSSMKLVSNVKCRRFMVEEYKQREYSSLLRKIILDCIKLKTDLPNDELPPLIREKKKTNKRLIILVSSTLGLCGGYNSELFKFFNDNYKRNDEIIVIGEKARVELSKHDNIKIYTINAEYERCIHERIEYAPEVIKAFTDKKDDRFVYAVSIDKSYQKLKNTKELAEEIIEKILDLVLTYGLSNVQNSIFSLNKDNITLEDLFKLEQEFKRPETYFKKKS